MAGTLTISTLSDGTNSTSSTNCIQGSAKAWVSYNGTTAIINASYNVTSVTKVGTGVYTVNFTNAFADTKYATCATSGSSTGYGCREGSDRVAKSTTSVTIVNYNLAGTDQDSTSLGVSIFR